MGLLDALNSDEGLFGLSLLAAGAPRAGGRTSLGEGLLGASQAVAQRRQQMAEQAMRQQMQQAQMQEMQARAQERAMALAAAQQQAAQQAAEEDAYRKALRTPQQQAMAQNGGPTVAAANAAPGLAPSFDQQALIANLIGPNPKKAAELLQPKPVDYKVVGDSLVQIGQGGVKEAYRAPDKPEKTPEALRTLEMIYGKGSPEYQAAAQRLAGKMTTHQPGTTVSVNTGQRGLDNTLKLRGDFRSEPVYKAHQEMQSAHSQIKQALGQKSPAGDLAGATKIMKLLDPGSVVRESELGMAMQASGLMDRVENYARNIMNGTKLTPTQRDDFQRLADALYGESVKQYNGKRSEYQGIAERNGLSVPDVLGSESAMPGAVRKYNPATGKIE